MTNLVTRTWLLLTYSPNFFEINVLPASVLDYARSHYAIETRN